MSGRRTRARRYAVLALYQWQLTGQDPVEIGRHLREDPDWAGEIAESFGSRGNTPQAYDSELFRQLLYGISARRQELDTGLQSVLDRPIEQVDPVERAILRLGAYELLYSPSVPYRVAIDEAVGLAKLLGAEQGHRYVNGVLDRLRTTYRVPGADVAVKSSQGTTSDQDRGPRGKEKSRRNQKLSG